MGPEKALPLPANFDKVDEYIEALFQFCSTSRIWDLFCGGVHILDFFTRDPDLYAWLLPLDWRAWFDLHDLDDILDFLLREDLSIFETVQQWRGQASPPPSLLQYTRTVRDLCLDRTFKPATSHNVLELPRHIAVGMNVKKVHEVVHFSEYLASFCESISSQTDHKRQITHLVDFGSGQNYLGRTLASPLYEKHVIAVEGRKANIEGSRQKDVHARLAPMEKRTRMVNKKEWVKEYAKIKEEKARMKASGRDEQLDVSVSGRAKSDAETILEGSNLGSEGEKTASSSVDSVNLQPSSNENPSLARQNPDETKDTSKYAIDTDGKEIPIAVLPASSTANNVSTGNVVRARLDHTSGKGSIQYVEHRLEDGNLAAVIDGIFDPPHDISDPSHQTAKPEVNGVVGKQHQESPSSTSTTAPNLLVMSIHSCGNLSHHGLRSLTLNPAVTAIAIVGCCYNLVSERLTPPSYKLPGLRPSSSPSPTSSPFPHRPPGDPHGYPMSERLANLSDPIHLNITARMMAVQAPQNWTKADSNSFFTRHYYRALLQRVFLDRGCVDAPPATDTDGAYHAAASLLGGNTAPIVIGSLRKQCYDDFVSYVRGATAKLIRGDDGSPGGDAGKAARAKLFRENMAGMTDVDIAAYDEREKKRKKEVSIVWSLMSFSAQLVEAVMVVDRWLWLSEQDEVQACWVEAAWEYSESPRNLVVVGVKQR